MLFTLSQTTLPKMTLLMLISHAKESLNKQKVSIEAQLVHPIKREFFFELVMNHNKQKETAFISYLEVDASEQIAGGIQKITVPEGDYVTFSIDKALFDQEIHSHIRHEVDAYFTKHGLLADPSNVFALFEETDNQVVAYLPFRKK